MRSLPLITILGILLLLGCSGKDRITVDKIPPVSPIMIPHLGDTGDGFVQHNNQTIYLNEDNNGIDAVPDEDWFQISWEHLLDTDLDYIRIFRFDNIYNQPMLIDSVKYSNIDYYIDDTDTLFTHRKYSYFIEAIDQSGNSAVSDTVTYALISKQILTSPAYDEVTDPSNLTFEWQKSGFVSKFRLLIFDYNHEEYWHYDIDVAFEPDFFSVAAPVGLFEEYESDHIYWRVDAFDTDYELDILIGSESNERRLYLAQK